ncbi:MAG: prepilin-type N-terminal cleavage/methylation domain-containing protein [Candidatus Aminicenantes bacterium]|nr:prepilin-type N-terminal cleavage/methylation domain-containing protein [Candidatus Aminicenantes bacterium]
MRGRKKRGEGFSLLEVVIGIALVAIAVLGLAEMFTLGVLNNLRAERIANASFLAQQQIDIMRNLTVDEFTALTTSNGIDLNGDGAMDILKDEPLDINNDGQFDYRRITEIQVDASGASLSFKIDVFIFSREQLNAPKDELLLNPIRSGVRSKITTAISR